MIRRPIRFCCAAIFAVFCFLFSGSSHGVAAETEGLELFEKHIRPALVDQCIRCHGEKKQQGGLRLDSREGWQTGGDSGPAIIPGKPEESLLVSAVRYESTDLEMPPKGVLPKSTIAAIEKWVELGAPDPRSSQPSMTARGDGPPSVEEGRKFWSFQPIDRPGVPEVVDQSWPRTDIDRFILARLEREPLQPVADADPMSLIRRVYFDLIGLPPTPEQIEAFLSDESPSAYPNLIDSLLESPQFGQRWGRHWLDVVRFAESSGGGRTLLFPDAWRYRDYVIDCFNEDFPYDQFLREQIAGDLLVSDGWQDKRRKLIATALLLLGPTNYELQDKDILEMDVVDEQLDTIGKGMLGMTIGCARCHDHKFDPIPTHDYYAMAGILKSTKAMIHSNVSQWNTVGLPLPPDQEAAIKAHEQQLASIKAELSEATKAWKKAGGVADKNKAAAKNVDPQSLPGIVVDDDQGTRVGQWTESTSISGYVGSRYIHDGTADKGQKSVQYKLDLPAAGQYEVRVSYTPSTNRSTRVPVHIHHRVGETVVRVNQKQIPKIDGHFESLGVFEFDPAQQPRIVISNDGTEDGVVIADAVVLVPQDLPTLPKPDEVDIPENIAFIVQDPTKLAGIVIDDVQAELVGSWKHSVHTPPFVGSSYIHDEKDGKGEKSATFTPDLPASGTYEVRVSHNTNVRRAENVPVTIRHADGETVVMINEGQEAPIDKLFRSLGKFRFNAGEEGSVTFSNQGTDGKYVIVDAVQFIAIDNGAEEKKARLMRLKAEVDDLSKKVKDLEKSAPKHPIAMATGDDKDAGDIHLAIRGVVHNKGPITPRGVLQVASTGKFPKIPDGQSGRKELADWISSPQNPLTARVMANRVWYWLVGRGIVSTVDNFGSMGQPPSHPELLDHLAAALIDNGWSVKTLIREIMLSRVYMLSTDTSDVAMQVDPSNRLLWQMNRKRLRAEDIRDALLFVSGQLDHSHGGSNIKPGTNSEYGYKFDSRRRSVYVPVFRNTLPELFEVFDFADPNIQSGKRNQSTIASQALLLMNHPLVIEQSNKAAAELLGSGPSETISRIRRAYRQVLGRLPNDEELSIAVDFIEATSQDENPQTPWAMLYQTLFQSVDFRYLN